jgi:hypothetical protein
VARLKTIGGQLYIQLDSYWNETNKVALAMRENADVLPFLLSWLSSAERSAERSYIIAHLLTATEAMARVSPDAFASVAHPDVWEPILTEWARSGDHWTARLAAVRLLGRLRRVTDRIVIALRAAMHDVSFVQKAAYEAAGEFRRVDGDILQDLLRLLDDPSARVAAAATQLLVGIARSEGAATDRRRILRGLQDAATNSSTTRPIYLVDELVDLVHDIRFVDRLDRILYRAVFEISRL